MKRRLMQTCFFVFGVVLLSIGSQSFAAEPASRDHETFTMPSGRLVEIDFPRVKETWQEGRVRWCIEHGQRWLLDYRLDESEWLGLKLMMGAIDAKDTGRTQEAVLLLRTEKEIVECVDGSFYNFAYCEARKNILKKLKREKELWKGIDELGVRVTRVFPPTIEILREWKRHDHSVYKK